MPANVHVYTVRGFYRASWNGVDLGVTEDGWTIQETPEGDPIHSDDGGNTLLDGVARGMNCIIVGRAQEATKVEAAIYAAQGGAGAGTANVGKLWRSLAKVLILTPVALPRNAAAGRPVIRASYALVLSPVTQNFNSRLATVDVTFTLFPDENGKLYFKD